eukprot:scaffold505430_cov28-Prasinocladus_malaysianus.AAC.1
MGSLNFNDRRRVVLEVLNNGPTPVSWRGFILTKNDHQKRLQFEEDREPGEVRQSLPSSPSMCDVISRIASRVDGNQLSMISCAVR